MAVVINDFEVVTEPPPAQPASGAPSNSPAPQSEAEKAAELGRALVRHKERHSRVRAH